VLFGDNVLDVMREFAVILREQTVFATILRSLANKVARGRIHRSATVGFQVAFRF
jgi:hypothetical protein